MKLSKALFQRTRFPTFDSTRKYLPLVIERHHVTSQYLDIMEHMNIRHYMNVFDDASQKLLEKAGMSKSYILSKQVGMFTLQHHITYLREIKGGSFLNVYAHLHDISPSKKKVYVFLWIANLTNNTIAAQCEAVFACADLKERKTIEFPLEIDKELSKIHEEHKALPKNFLSSITTNIKFE